MTIKLTSWHETESGIEFVNYNDHDNIHELVMEGIKELGLNVKTRSRIFVISDKISKLQLEAILKAKGLINVKVIESKL